jgi:hypothetical protein
LEAAGQLPGRLGSAYLKGIAAWYLNAGMNPRTICCYNEFRDESVHMRLVSIILQT